MPAIRILSVAELAALSIQASFADASQLIITTADVKAIDVAVGSLVALWNSCGLISSLPTLRYSGVYTHPPAPENLRKYIPQAKWGARDEKVERLVQGIDADGFAILFMREDASSRWEAFGVAAGASRLSSRRSIPMDAALAITDNSLRAAWAAQEKALIDKVAAPGLPGAPAPRI